MLQTSRINNWCDKLINRSYAVDKNALGLYRICYALHFILFGLPIYRWIPYNPDIFFDPPKYSLAAFFSGFPPFEFFIAIDIFLIVLLIALLFGYKTTATSILLSMVWLIGSSFKYSFNMVDHNIFLILTPFILSFSGWGKAFSIDAKTKDDQNRKSDWDPQKAGLPIFLMALFLGFGYLTAGYAKLFSWLDFDLSTHGVRSWVLRAIYVSQKEALVLPYIINISDPSFWEALDVLAVCFEMSFFLAVFNKNIFKLFLCIGVIFHFTNMLILDIPFRNIMIVYLLFINWDLVKQIAKNFKIPRFFTRRNFVIILLIYLTSYILSGMIENSVLFSLSLMEWLLTPIFKAPSFWINHIIMSVALFIAVSWLYKRIPIIFNVFQK